MLGRREYLASRLSWASCSVECLVEAGAQFPLAKCGGLSISTCFSGLGTPEVCAEALVTALRSRSGIDVDIKSVLAFDLSPASRKVLISDPCISAVGADLLGLWPAAVRERLARGFDTLQDLFRYAVGVSTSLRLTFWCHASQSEKGIDLGQIHVAGSPCTDFSTMGKRRGFRGPTSAALITWVLLVRRHRLWIVIHENVCGFDIATLMTVL